MSQHRSLRAASTFVGKRNVIKRFERTEPPKTAASGKTVDVSRVCQNRY
jgi:small basic protein (TIGR04137 family)